MTVDKKYIKRAFSQSPLRTFIWNSNIATLYPDFSFDACVQAINNDPTARRAVNHFINKAMEGDYAVIKKESKEYDRAFELVLDEKYKFRTDILRKAFYTGKLFKNVFIEIVKDLDNKTKSLNILNPQDIDPITEPNGDPIRYKSKTPNPITGKYAEWSKDEIVWVKIDDRGVGFAPVDIRALWETLLLKDYVRRYVSWLWKTGQYRLIYKFKDASDKDIEDFLAYGRRNDDKFEAPFLVKGEVETTLLRNMQENEFIINLFKYLDNQILMLLDVPPLDAGIPDASGRSNADAQGNNFTTSITSFKKIFEDAINYDLFPKMNKSNNLLKFSPADRFAEKQVYEVLQIMQSLGLKKEIMQEYMIDKGLVFEEKEYFDPIGDAILGAKNPRNLDMMPSRQGKGTGEANQNQDTITTRSDQLKKE